MDTRTLVMLTLSERSAAPVTVSIRNKARSTLQARVYVCGFDRASLKGEGAPVGEFHAVRWGMLGVPALALKPGAQQTSRALTVSGTSTHVVVYGEGAGLKDCECVLQAVPDRPPAANEGN